MIWVKDWNEDGEDPDVDIFNIIQKVQDTGIHLEVDEEQWKITQGSKRQAKWVWFPRTMSGLRFPATPHAQHQTQRSTRLDRKQTKEYLGSPWMTHVCFASNNQDYHTSWKTLHEDSASKKPPHPEK